METATACFMTECEKIILFSVLGFDSGCNLTFNVHQVEMVRRDTRRRLATVLRGHLPRLACSGYAVWVTRG